MTHYICTGTCKGMSEDIGMCGVDSCPKNGEHLEKCECSDAHHDGRQNKKEE